MQKKPIAEWKQIMTLCLKCMMFFYLLLICDGIVKNFPTKNVALSRRKRYLPFLGNSLVITLGIGIPVEIDNNHVLIGLAIRASYSLPTNLSQVRIADYNRRTQRSLSRWDVYKLLEQDSEIRGYGGRHCVLRLICQESDAPLDKYNGLFEEFFHVLFTPPTTNEDVQSYINQEYYEAQLLGRKYRGRCQEFFPDCKITHLDMFTHYTSL